MTHYEFNGDEAPARGEASMLDPEPLNLSASTGAETDMSDKRGVLPVASSPPMTPSTTARGKL